MGPSQWTDLAHGMCKHMACGFGFLGQFPGSAQATALEAKGHKWRETDQIGAANGIRFNPDGTVTAVSEPLRHGGGSAITQKQ